MTDTLRQKYADLEAKADAAEAAGVSSEAFRDAIDTLLDDAAIARCECCNVPIFDGAPCTYDSISGLDFCFDCSSDWNDVLRDPESFYRHIDGDEVYFTPDTAKAAADAHVAAGGALTDKFGLHPY